MRGLSHCLCRLTLGMGVELIEDRCFFCDETAGSSCLHNASTYDVGSCKCALELEDTTLLAKLALHDMITL